MQPKTLIALCFSTLLSFAAWAGSDTIPIPSSWVNTQGSTLTLSSADSAGKIIGTYVNHAAGYNCQNIAYPVTGWVYGTAITFDTKWESASESCNSITSWAGYYYQGQITTFWNLVQNGSITSSQIIQGKDSFTPLTKVFNKKLMHKK